jgi:HK97 family phage major capsid protein
MTVQLNSRTFDELTNCIQELETLTSKPGNMSTKEEKRHSFLLAKMAMLRQGVSVSELRNFEKDRILREIGYQLPAQARTKLGEEIEGEYRKWLLTGECRSVNRPPESESRSYTGELAGTQSIFYTKEPQGGAFVATDFASRSFDVQAVYNEIMSDWAATIVDTATGSAFPVPSIDDTQNAATILGESAQGSEVTVANFSQKTLQTYKFATGILALTIELETDSAFPWGAVLEKLFSIRMARGVGQKLVNGTGVGQPTGLLTAVMASGAVPIIAAGSSANDGGSGTGTNSLGSADLVKCLHALDKAYRQNAIWAMSDDTLLFLEEIVTKQGLPLVKFRQGTTDEGDVPFILGRRVAVCPSMSDIGPATNPVVLYAPEYFIVRRVPSSLYLQAFREAPGLVENGLIGLQMYGRYDSTLVATQNASHVPASFIQCHS